jgi:hypothetical protein
MDLLAAIGRYRGVHHFGCGSKLDSTRSIQFAPRIRRKGNSFAAAMNTI